MVYLSTPPLTPPSTHAPSDILFTSATVVAGDDTPAYEADVLVIDGIISKITPPGHLAGTQDDDIREVDAKGFWLTPGFIDMHAHSDLYLLTHPDHEAKITQGCTVSHRRLSRSACPHFCVCFLYHKLTTCV